MKSNFRFRLTVLWGIIPSQIKFISLIRTSAYACQAWKLCHPDVGHAFQYFRKVGVKLMLFPIMIPVNDHFYRSWNVITGLMRFAVSAEVNRLIFLLLPVIEICLRCKLQCSRKLHNRNCFSASAAETSAGRLQLDSDMVFHLQMSRTSHALRHWKKYKPP
jgi:hypothetical protein